MYTVPLQMAPSAMHRSQYSQYTTIIIDYTYMNMKLECSCCNEIKTMKIYSSDSHKCLAVFSKTSPATVQSESWCMDIQYIVTKAQHCAGNDGREKVATMTIRKWAMTLCIRRHGQKKKKRKSHDCNRLHRKRLTEHWTTGGARFNIFYHTWPLSFGQMAGEICYSPLNNIFVSLVKRNSYSNSTFLFVWLDDAW